jgi:hypothetical protein
MFLRVAFAFVFLSSSALVAVDCPQSLLADGALYIFLPSDASQIGAATVNKIVESAEVQLEVLQLPRAKLRAFLLKVRLSLHEGVTNAMEWGNSFRPGTTARLSLIYTPGANGALGALDATIQDQGNGYDPNACRWAWNSSHQRICHAVFVRSGYQNTFPPLGLEPNRHPLIHGLPCAHASLFRNAGQ